jgi:hypothetical protein
MQGKGLLLRGVAQSWINMVRKFMW